MCIENNYSKNPQTVDELGVVEHFYLVDELVVGYSHQQYKKIINNLLNEESNER